MAGTIPKNTVQLIKKYPIITCQCENPRIMFTNDGGSYQKCLNCGCSNAS
jgi:hypothetical protein